MSIETATYVDSLDTANPADTDSRSSADDHARLIKASLRRTFPAIASQVSASHGEMNFLRSASVAIQAQIDVIKSGSYSVTYAKSAGYAASAIYAASTSRVIYAESAGYVANAGAAASAGSSRIATVARMAATAHVSATWTALASLSLNLAASSVYRVECGGIVAMESGVSRTVQMQLVAIGAEPVPGALVWTGRLNQSSVVQYFSASDPATTRTYNQVFNLYGDHVNSPFSTPACLYAVLETSAAVALSVRVKGPNNNDHSIYGGFLSAVKIGTR